MPSSTCTGGRSTIDVCGSPTMREEAYSCSSTSITPFKDPADVSPQQGIHSPDQVSHPLGQQVNDQAVEGGCRLGISFFHLRQLLL